MISVDDTGYSVDELLEIPTPVLHGMVALGREIAWDQAHDHYRAASDAARGGRTQTRTLAREAGQMWKYAEFAATGQMHEEDWYDDFGTMEASAMLMYLDGGEPLDRDGFRDAFTDYVETERAAFD